MSASLVGSEMCIRDRLSPLRATRVMTSPRLQGTSGGHDRDCGLRGVRPCLLYTSDAADDM
eukprot:5187425-Alexandrium_andersonii.AAC.1